MPINIGDKLVPTNRSKIAVESLYIYDTVTGKKLSDINNYVMGEGEGSLQEALNKSSNIVIGTYDKVNGTFSDSLGNILELITTKIYIDTVSGISYFFTGSVLKPELNDSVWNDVI